MVNFLKSFHKENSIRQASGILIITLVISNLLGVLRDHYLAQKIPTTILDTYYAAFRIPDLIFNVLILGAIASAFIPVFTNYLTKNEKQTAWLVANSILTIAIIALIGLCGLLAIFMPIVIPWIVPKFDPGKQHLTITLARMLLLSPVFFGISYILGGILNSFQRFLTYSLAPIVYNLSIIVGTLLLADQWGIKGVVGAVLIGAFLHLVIQIPVTLKLGWRPKFILNIFHPGVKKIAILMLPRAIGLGSMQLMLVAFTAIATFLGAQSVAIYNLADNIQTMPTVVFGTSFATAIFPVLSKAFAQNNQEVFDRYFIKTFRIIIYLLLPATIGIILLRVQIVRLILGSGHFGWEQTVLTANTLGMFSLSLVASGLASLLARSFYARHNTRLPMVITIISALISILLGWLLSRTKLEIAGLALGFSLGSFFNAIALFWLLKPKIPSFSLRKNLSFIFYVLTASLAMAIFIQLVKIFIGNIVPMNRFWGVATQTISSIIIGGGIYFFLTWLLGCQESKDLKSIFQKIIRRTTDEPNPPED